MHRIIHFLIITELSNLRTKRMKFWCSLLILNIEEIRLLLFFLLLDLGVLYFFFVLFHSALQIPNWLWFAVCFIFPFIFFRYRGFSLSSIFWLSIEVIENDKQHLILVQTLLLFQFYYIYKYNNTIFFRKKKLLNF